MLLAGDVDHFRVIVSRHLVATAVDVPSAIEARKTRFNVSALL